VARRDNGRAGPGGKEFEELQEFKDPAAGTARGEAGAVEVFCSSPGFYLQYEPTPHAELLEPRPTLICLDSPPTSRGPACDLASSSKTI
jgi:hypothetical protein